MVLQSLSCDHGFEGLAFILWCCVSSHPWVFQCVCVCSFRIVCLVMFCGGSSLIQEITPFFIVLQELHWIEDLDLFSMNKRAVLWKPSNKKMGSCSEERKWVGVIIKLNLSQCLISHQTMNTCRNRGTAPSIVTWTEDGSELSASVPGSFTPDYTVDRSQR
jgi:hypothetical protein